MNKFFFIILLFSSTLYAQNVDSSLRLFIQKTIRTDDSKMSDTATGICILKISKTDNDFKIDNVWQQGVTIDTQYLENMIQSKFTIGLPAGYKILVPVFVSYKGSLMKSPGLGVKKEYKAYLTKQKKYKIMLPIELINYPTRILYDVN